MIEDGVSKDTMLREIAAAAGISRVADVTALDRIGIPVVMVIRPCSRAFVVSQGKGLDKANAERSGIMESLEGYFAENIHSELIYQCSDELIATQRGVKIDRLPRVRGRRVLPGERLLWISGLELNTGREIWVPFECVHADYSVPSGVMPGHFLVSSTGLAVAFDRASAVLHALCEVIERDALAVFAAKNGWLESTAKIDLTCGVASDTAALIGRVEKAQIEVHAWDVTSDIGIPVIWVTLVDKNASISDLVRKSSGLGCHPEAGRALSKALLEAVQSRATVISGSRDDLLYADYLGEERLGTASEKPFEIRPRSALRVNRSSDLRPDEYLSNIAQHLSRLGFADIVVVCLSRSEPRVAAVRVIVPGLEGPHLHPDYTPGLRAVRATQ